MSNPYGAGNTGWLVYQTFDNHWALWPRDGFYAGVSLTDPDLIVANQWYYLTLVYDGSLFTLYVNGVAKISGTDPGFVQNGNVPAGRRYVSYNYNYNTANGLPVQAVLRPYLLIAIPWISSRSAVSWMTSRFTTRHSPQHRFRTIF